MRLRTRNNQQQDQRTQTFAPPAADDTREALHTAAEQLLAAGDEAIARALSDDSEAFLEANRQQGGQ